MFCALVTFLIYCFSPRAGAKSEGIKKRADSNGEYGRPAERLEGVCGGTAQSYGMFQNDTSFVTCMFIGGFTGLAMTMNLFKVLWHH